MMNKRPDYLDLSGIPQNEITRPLQSPGNLAPPRTGEIAPALSPLDAFAMQSRLLARRFDEEAEAGRRISRLPPLTIQNELARLPSYFRQSESVPESILEESPLSARSDSSRNTGLLLAVPKEQRPKSTHPTIHGADATGTQQRRQPPLTGIGEESETPQRQPKEYFDLPRAQSPEVVETRVERPTPTSPVSLAVPRSPTSPQSGYALSLNSLTMSPTRDTQGLKPPRSPLPMLRNSPTIRTVYDSSDDVDNLSIGGSIDSLPIHKASTSSSFSRSHSPAFAFHMPLPRSPSAASDASFGSAAPRPSFNFSRPLSAMSRPSMDPRATPEPGNRPVSRGPRNGTMDSTSTRPSIEGPSRQNTGESLLAPTPSHISRPSRTSTGEDSDPAPDEANAGQSYTYSKFTLPRGRAVDRQSIAPGDFMLKQFDWNAEAASARTSVQSRDGSPGAGRPRTLSNKEFSPFPTLHAQRRSDGSTGSPKQRRLVHQKSASGPDSIAESTSFPNSAISVATTISTSSDASTIKAQMAIGHSASRSMSTELTTEQHLQRGIELHEAGKLPQSTYHLRIAAKVGHPTAMLLYALACRHGWGMRPSQAEGVAWLQKAVDSAQLEIADDEDLIAQGNDDPSTLHERKTHKAQFALSVYELGMSYMNGWGVEKNRGLGLRCFEVAGNWGDPDALAEAAFCYAEGVGCKKDLKKAASLYREAEKRGMSMAGNSWIYKEKYMTGNDPRGSGERGRSSVSAKGGAKEKKRDKSRTRSIFGRKKSFVNEIIQMPG